MNKYDELAANIIDMVSDQVENQHPEIRLHTKDTKEAGITDPAVICCEGYYLLEQEIARKIKRFVKIQKIRKFVRTQKQKQGGKTK